MTGWTLRPRAQVEGPAADLRRIGLPWLTLDRVVRSSAIQAWHLLTGPGAYLAERERGKESPSCCFSLWGGREEALHPRVMGYLPGPRQGTLPSHHRFGYRSPADPAGITPKPRWVNRSEHHFE